MNGWRKSTYSGNAQSQCVEVRPGTRVGVRDSKHRTGGTLDVRPTTWRTFVASITR